MKRRRGSPGILAAVGLVSVLLAASAIVAESRTKGSMRIVVVDDEGNRHEETHEFDGDNPRPFLGVRLAEAPEGGALIEGVIEDTAAESAGLRDGDVIVGYDGRRIDSPRDLTRLVRDSEPGDRIDLELIRDGAREIVTVEIGERQRWGFAYGWDADALQEHMQRLGERLENMEFHFDTDAFEEHMQRLGERLQNMEYEFDTDAFEEQMEHLGERLRHMELGFGDPGHHGWRMRTHRPVLGVELVDATPELRQHLGGSAEEGVLVGRVLADSAAEAAGVRVGDLIVAVDGEPIEDVGDLRRTLREREGTTFDLDVVRDGRRDTLSVSLAEREEASSPTRRPRLERRHEPLSDADRS